MAVHRLQVQDKIVQVVIKVGRAVVGQVVFLRLEAQSGAVHGVKVVLQLFLQVLPERIVVETILLD